MVTQVWTNLAPDPVVTQSSGGLSVNWTFGGGDYGGLADISASGGPSITNRYAYGDLIGATGPLNAIITYNSPIPFTVGESVTVVMWAWLDSDAASNMAILCLDANDNVLANLQGSPEAYIASTWVERRVTASIPTGTTRIIPSVSFNYTGDSSDHQIRGTALAVVPSVSGLDYSGAYFDGSYVDTPESVFAWTGSAFNSASTLTLTLPEVASFMAAAVATPVPDPISPRTFKPIYLKDFSVQEDATPVAPSDSSGAVSSINLQVDENGDTPYLLNVPIDLIDPAQGTTRGTIRNVASDNTDATLTADSRMALLNVDRVMMPFTGTLEDALLYYLSECAITDGIVIEEGIRDIPVVFPGFSGNVWFQIAKKICPALGIEVSLVSNNVVFRPVRGRVSENYRDSSRSWAYDTSQQARSVEIIQYHVDEVANGLLYPQGGWNGEVTVYAFEAGTTTTINLPIDGSISSVDQPVYQTTIGPNDSSASVYNIVGNDNLPITQANWEAWGGSVVVSIADDTRSLNVTVTTPAQTEYAPYRIGVSDGETVYSTLRLVGDAILWERETHTYYTAVDPDRVTNVLGATVDNEYLQTDQQVFDAALNELRRWGGNRRTISVATQGINRLSDNGSYAYATFEDFDQFWAATGHGNEFGDFDAEAANEFGGATTFGGFDEWWVEQVQDDFANQAFGNIAGARVFTETNVHRIRTATITPAGITYSADEDSIFSDFDNLYGSIDFGGFDDAWDAALPGATFGDFDATPLRKVL